MDPVLRLALIFGLGLFVQAVFLIRNDFRKNIKRLLGVLFFSLGIAVVIFLASISDDSKIMVSDVYLFLFWFYILFILIFTGSFFYKALCEINEKILLVWTLIFWYAYAINFNVFQWESGFFIVPTFIVVVAGFAPAHMDYFWKAFLYAWFLFVLVFLAIVQFESSSLALLLNPKKISSANSLLAAFSTGMVFMSVVLYGSHLLAFLPSVNRYKNISDRFREIREHAINLSMKYSDYQMAFKEALIILVLIGGIFLGNYYFKTASNELIINLAIIGSFLYSERPRRSVA